MAIAGHWDEADGAAEARRDPRRKLRLEAQGALASGAADRVLVHNISATGLLVESALALAPGETLTIDLPEAGETQASVVWTSGSFYGCQFEQPISAGALSAAQLRGTADRDIANGPSFEGLASETFGARLQRLRTEQRLTQAQLADRLGVSKPTVWAWEQGKARPVESRIDSIARALEVSREELLSGSGDTQFNELVAMSRERIARAVGTEPRQVRIMIEL